MSLQQKVALIEYGFVFVAGLYSLAMGRRWVGKNPGASEAYDRWHAKTGRHLAWMGPLLCAFAVFMLIERMNR